MNSKRTKSLKLVTKNLENTKKQKGCIFEMKEYENGSYQVNGYFYIDDAREGVK